MLTIAMVDPLDINTLDSIEVMTDAEVEPVVCSEREVNQLINSLYGMQSGLGGIMENMEIESSDAQSEEAPDKEEVQVASLHDMAG